MDCGRCWSCVTHNVLFPTIRVRCRQFYKFSCRKRQKRFCAAQHGTRRPSFACLVTATNLYQFFLPFASSTFRLIPPLLNVFTFQVDSIRKSNKIEASFDSTNFLQRIPLKFLLKPRRAATQARLCGDKDGTEINHRVENCPVIEFMSRRRIN